MNKRSFIKSILIGCVAPTLLLSVASDRAKWKVSRNGLWVMNPEYFQAEYEVVFLGNSSIWKQLADNCNWTVPPFKLTQGKLDILIKWA